VVSHNIFPNFERLHLRRKAGGVVTKLAAAVTNLVTVIVDKAGCEVLALGYTAQSR